MPSGQLMATRSAKQNSARNFNGHRLNGSYGEPQLQAGLTSVDFWVDCLSVK